jgi:integrative and conjugative element protein (TIGR02256 family)
MPRQLTRSPSSRYSHGEITVEFSGQVLEVFKRYLQTGRRNEAGGILLGRIYDGNTVVVEVATTPNKEDKAGRYFFDRSRNAAQEIVTCLWEQSGGEIVYLGEWHTHPERNPSPSPRDKDMIRSMFNDTKMETNSLILTIVGLEGRWVGVQDRQGLTRCSQA